ncbi:2-ketogluconate reductase [Colletotrichum salicis]|uniref:2-ketogluconate reductase n=1 Tax=Colletotrichum salicis TaxID=1209931 RepID=A0A135UGY3_9PEZI|nr:2-ketogluconate reductase [Colletotrichum salicis]
MSGNKPIVIRLGEDIKYNYDYYKDIFTDRFTVVVNKETDRASFIKALKEKKYGDFSAIFRPHFQSGGEMGQWDDELIDLLPSSVRIFASEGAGFNWADVDALARRKIWYANGAGASDEAVSDTGLFMILSVFRNFWRAQRAAKTCDPQQFLAMHRLVGGISWSPRDHVLGIVGLGNISKKLAYKARTALDMKIHYYDVVRSPPEVEEELQATFHPTLHQLLADLINKEAFAAMKNGARLINTARGEVVNEEALIGALQSGKLSAAGLDVHYHEPQVSKTLADMENVTLTCHNGGAAIITRVNFELNAMKNIVEVVGSDGAIRLLPRKPGIRGPRSEALSQGHPTGILPGALIPATAIGVYVSLNNTIVEYLEHRHITVEGKPPVSAVLSGLVAFMMSEAIQAQKQDAEHTEKRQTLLPDELPLPQGLERMGIDELRSLERGLIRRLDLSLMPSVFMLFLLNILDRNNIASAKITGLTETLNITNAGYNTSLLMFYVGYYVTQVPSNLIIGKVRPSYYICLITSLWRVLSMCQGFTTNFSQLAAVRFILGLVEAPFLPAVFVLMSCWYNRKELPPRIATLYGGNIACRRIFGTDCRGYHLGHGRQGRKTTVDYPLQSKHLFISREHQLYAEWRIRKENAGIVDEDPESIFWGLKQALIDPKLYLFIVRQMALITAQSFNNFFPSIVGTLGYGQTTTLLLTSPPYFFAFIVSLCISFHASHKDERGYHIVISMIFALLGNLLAMFVPCLGGRYFSMFLMTYGSYAPYNLCVSWLSSSLPRPRAKRAAALAIVNFMAAGVAHFYTSYMFPDSQKPRYYTGDTVMSGAYLVCAGVALSIKYYLKKQNGKFEEEERLGVTNHSHIKGSKLGHGGEGVVSFRYVH